VTDRRALEEPPAQVARVHRGVAGAECAIATGPAGGLRKPCAEGRGYYEGCNKGSQRTSRAGNAMCRGVGHTIERVGARKKGGELH